MLSNSGNKKETRGENKEENKEENKVKKVKVRRVKKVERSGPVPKITTDALHVHTEEKSPVPVKVSCPSENDYVMQTMLTCLGNKRLLVNDIRELADKVCSRLGKEKLVIMDGFSGSSVVSRKLSYVASKLYVNDLEEYAYLLARCYLETPSDVQQQQIISHIEKMNEIASSGPYVRGFVSEMYAPEDTENIQEGERCFYTRENAEIIDTLREYIRTRVPLVLQKYCMVPLLTKASIHANTSGVFKGFHSENGVGKWGGAAARCLPRIKGGIQLEVPLWNTGSDYVPVVTKRDVNELMRDMEDGSLDLVYLDPPYNQHPYGSNYFMLNLIAGNESPDPSRVSRVSGITKDWNRSNYNYRDKALRDMAELVDVGLKKSRYLLISYNDEGLIRDDDWAKIFEGYVVEKHEIKYNTYRGSRNLAGRNDKVMERMYLVCRGEE
tara:strand:+ start:333 stop:1649 length:1317 start_codon:yes stop_codon:yes gene_type:complete